MQRRELLSSLFAYKEKENKEKIIRPPYFKDEEVFFSNCTSCEGLCSKVCEENIIIIQEDSTPKLDFSISGCTYCDECAKACPNDVLNIENKKHIDAKIEIDVISCLSWHQTMCFSCKDPCFYDAIDFLAMFRPTINQNCTACGLCIKSCPTDAIKIIS
ncbi:ferredoxin-type protein NapF [Aliarcobacter butzleri]|jgi:ferredoxin-type protein NapF|uniref:Ferredoxin-type protein NapF n=4 Tax=Aliarcobacter butzleri TaxID=28197 RepID=A0AAW7PPD6_9BACT|nr:ferredoxin-type protein NapF [Aliarcobacter butzleri]KLD99822.1 ferredoxin [Aliarcobacter butzleri L348]KLE03214.1 ferredoxin [Aliarcobacter butzleri L352]KLE04323.1 ferredoxin [Aliarcobacter butzleri L353]KLE09318.1 ferredoxin [Aliarcobacter butzleri L355]MCG3667023.1 ferredoxin-type protein NapF [Aliarcobacter butzleri]